MINEVSEAELTQRIQDKIFPQDKVEREKAKPPVKTAPEAPKQDTQPAEPQDTIQADDSAPGGQDTIEAEENYEFEFQGSRYQVPKELKELHEGYLRKEDYTKKTMTAAERTRHADLVLEQARQSQALQTSLQPKYEAVNELARSVKAYENVDWNSWISQDPVEAQKGMLQLQVLRDKEKRARDELQQAANEGMRAINETRARLMSENAKVLEREIKNWNADKQKALTQFAEKTYGFSVEELSKVYDARVVRMMHDAMQWADLQASKPQAQKKAAQVATLKPSATQSKDAKQSKEAELKRAIRVAKTDSAKADAVQKLLEHRLH